MASDHCKKFDSDYNFISYRSDSTFDLVQHLLLWDFLDDRENQWVLDMEFDEDVDFWVDWESDIELSDYDTDDS